MKAPFFAFSLLTSLSLCGVASAQLTKGHRQQYTQRQWSSGLGGQRRRDISQEWP